VTDARVGPVLRLRSVGVTLDGRPALSGIDLDVPAGELLALAGPNGSGKTTLLRAVLGLVPLASGSVVLWDRPLSDLSVRERALRVAWVPQQESLREDVPLERYVLYGRYPVRGPLGRETSEDEAKVRSILDAIGLADRARDSVLRLSGGERQRAALGRALAQETPLLLLDEPTSHLDIGHQLDLLERVRALARERKVTVVAALHDLNLAARYADRIVVLAHGRAVADGPAGVVLSTGLLARVWGIDAELRTDGATGRPYLVPRRLVGAPAPRTGSGAVHVVGGGGAATPLLRVLTDAGKTVTTGALHLLDTDAETAEALALPAAVEVPFAPLGPSVRERHRELLGAATAIVVAPFAVGPSNLANLEDIERWSGTTPVYLVQGATIAGRDFTDGRASAIVARLRAAGAVEVNDPEELLRALAPRASDARTQAAAP
jgi:iron complex transport system ATP-binding protein